MALGKRLSATAPEHAIVEFATAPALREYVDRGRSVDLFILDGEATPEGGMGVARQLKDEVFECPPIMLVVARVQDAWLAGWSKSDGVVTHPIDPFTIASTAERLLNSVPSA